MVMELTAQGWTVMTQTILCMPDPPATGTATPAPHTMPAAIAPAEHTPAAAARLLHLEEGAEAGPAVQDTWIFL